VHSGGTELNGFAVMEESIIPVEWVALSLEHGKVAP